MPEVYYRAYMESSYEFFLPVPTDYTIQFQQIRVLSHTPCGVWLDYWTGKRKKKFVNNSNKKRFAYPTIEEARESLGYRLRAYRSRLVVKLEIVEIELKAYDAIIRRTEL